MFPSIRRRMTLFVVMTLLLLALPASAGAAPELGCAGVTQVPLAECQALEALYTSANGAQWYDKTGWASTNTPCSWYGVTCQAGRVSALDLGDNNLAGTLPAQLADLTQLRSLVLARNAVAGALPAWLGNLPQLQTLDLSENVLTGSIPTQLANLAALQTLNLSDNRLTGSIPTQLSALLALRILNLSTNQLTGQIPGVLSSLADLRTLDLHNNQLSGAIPTQLSNLTNLEQLILSSNAFNGPIPGSLGALSNLTHLVLFSNQLSGEIPAQLSNLGQLRILMLNNNRLTGAIPSGLGNLANLREIYLNSNAFFGSVPDGFCSIATLQVEGVRLDFNALRRAPSCDKIDPFWSETQTVPPANLTAALAATQATLTWIPILYQNDAGYYEISYRPVGGAFTVHGVTGNKSASSYVVTGLSPGVRYEFRVRTFTAAHMDPPAYQQNDLWSDYTTIPRSTFLPLVIRR